VGQALTVPCLANYRIAVNCSSRCGVELQFNHGRPTENTLILA